MLIRYSNNKNGKPVKTAVVYTKEEHCIDRNKIDPDAIRIIEQLRNYGFSAYLVGGAVRDLIIGNEPKDFDIVTNATPSKIKKLFRNSRIIGKRFRLVHIFFGSKIFEVSTFRSLAEGTVGNSFGTMDEDVRRRDFTLNALYYDPIKEQCIDYVGGIRDIRKRIIRPVIPLDSIFIEDPVRMLRAVKYATMTGFKMPFHLKRKICKSANLLSPVSPSRLTEELLKIINSGHAYDIVKLALETDVYMYLQPAATAMMYAKPDFEKKYLDHLKELDELHRTSPDCRTGQKLVYLIYDFIAELTDWGKESLSSAAGELYTRTWTQCRNFVLPMNPQRSELEYAIRTVLKKLGISIRIPKDAFSKKKRPVRSQQTAASELDTKPAKAVASM
ncbi:MAG: polynucleotide adenylyltransferase PcnB [Treponemataceae bacterium]|nr:polynucleotide adenylyltransferase PcnB [Treponemataceae bacterium]